MRRILAVLLHLFSRQLAHHPIIMGVVPHLDDFDLRKVALGSLLRLTNPLIRTTQTPFATLERLRLVHLLRDDVFWKARLRLRLRLWLRFCLHLRLRLRLWLGLRFCLHLRLRLWLWLGLSLRFRLRVHLRSGAGAGSGSAFVCEATVNKPRRFSTSYKRQS